MAGLDVARVRIRSSQAHALVEPADTIAEAILRAAGLYGTAPTSHLGLAARVEGYTPGTLAEARLETRAVLRVPGMRGSVFLAPAELAAAFMALARPRTVRRTLAGEGIDGDDLESLMRRIDDLLAGRRLAARAIRGELADVDPGGPVTTLVLRTMAHEGRIVAAEPVGGDRATAYRYARMRDWAPDCGRVPPLAEALALVAPLWMRANGPGSVDDLAWWAGVTRRQAAAALAAMGARSVTVAGLAGEQWATEEVLDDLDTARPAGAIRFLPVWDAWPMARRERSRILDRASRPFVVDKSGNVTNTITLDGRIVGTWDVDGETLLVHRFEELPSGDLESAAAMLCEVVAWQDLREVEAEPLDEGGQNRFKAPLRQR